MKAFTTLTSTFIPLPNRDVDTDQIIPAVYLKVIDKDGLVDGLFSRWRYLPDGSPDPEFVINKPEYQHSEILLAGDNFGCGSSREHAPWALTGWGIRAIVSTSFADIFRSNALKNGLLPIVIDEETQKQLFSIAEEETDAELQIDLQNQLLILPDGRSLEFPIDTFSKQCMLDGYDQLGYLLKQDDAISAYEARTNK